MMTREDELRLLCGIARCYQANTGRPPPTVKELADHWYGLSDRLVSLEPPMTVLEVDAPDHALQCIWLRDVEKRPDADAMLADCFQRTVRRPAEVGK